MPAGPYTRVEPGKHWSTYRAVSLKTRSMGVRPLDVPPVPPMKLPLARTLWMDTPMPPAFLEMMAHFFSVS